VGSIWIDVKGPVDPFIEREAELKFLHLCLNPEDGPSPLTTLLRDPDGIGKTELARKYAEVYSEFYDNNAIWLDGRVHITLEISLYQLATSRLGIPKKAANEYYRPLSKSVRSV
jgi:hypothetical protein